MKTLIYTEDGLPTDETTALLATLKKGNVYYRSEATIEKEPCDVVYSNSPKVKKVYDEVKEIKPVKPQKEDK